MAQAIDLPDFRAWYNYAMAHKAQTLFALGMVLGLMAILSPWYSIDVNANGRHNPARDVTLTSYVDHYSTGYYVVTPLDSTACGCATVSAAFNGVLVTALAAAFLGAATVVLHFRNKIKGDLTVLLIAVTGILFIGAPVLQATSLPGAFAADNENLGGLNADEAWGASFMGGNVSQVRSITWGPSSGFFLSAGAGVLLLLCVYQIRMPKRPAMAPQPTPGAPMAYSQMTPVPPPPAPAPAPMPPPRL